MKALKLKIILGLGGIMLIFFLIGVLFMGMSGGGGGGDATITPAYATEEEAYAYQYVGAELGVPWDIVLLTDGMDAQASGKKNLKDYNPLYTSLQFCVLVEEVYQAVEIEEEETDASGEANDDLESEAGETETEESEESEKVQRDDEAEQPTQETETEPEIEWVLYETIYYYGKTDIIQYSEMRQNSLDYDDVNSFVTALYEVAEEKATDEWQFEVTLLANPDYEDVLRTYIGMEEQYIEYVMSLYELDYMSVLYGYNYEVGDVVLPDIVQGNVTRQELAMVAASLINHPYLFGGKSNEVGAPTGPLDCSGFVDWVYIQCFGYGVSNGAVPDGVAVSGTALMWYACEQITARELKVGDLGFMYNPASMRSGQINHVGIYIGKHDGKDYWIHCGGRTYGTDAAPTGRVGISLASGYNSYNPVDGTSFEPAMKACRFKYFRRPRFAFVGE